MAGVLLLAGIDDGVYVVIPAVIAAIGGGRGERMAVPHQDHRLSPGVVVPIASASSVCVRLDTTVNFEERTER